MRGIDVSENNGYVDFESIRESGCEFVIIRLGYGNRHLDSNFYENVNNAIDAGMKIGVYYYDYGLDVDDAINEARYTIDILQDCGLTPDKLPMGVWYDMEDADEWKRRNGMPHSMMLTDMCKAYTEELQKAGYEKCGVYASYDWLVNRIHTDRLNCLYWVAQWNSHCDYDFAAIWQYTDFEEIDGQQFDGNLTLMEF